MRRPGDLDDVEQIGGVYISEHPHSKYSKTTIKSSKWYIIRTNNYLPQGWALSINFLTIYALFATPVALVFTKSFSEKLERFELFIDICFFIDLLLNFFKLPPE